MNFCFPPEKARDTQDWFLYFHTKQNTFIYSHEKICKINTELLA